MVPDPLPRRGRSGPFGVAGALALLLLGAALSGCTSGDSPPPPPSASAGGQPTLAVTPAAGLVDGQAIVLEGRGWAPRAALSVAPCEADSTRCSIHEEQVATGDAGAFRLETVAPAAFVSWQGDPIDCRSTTCEYRIDRDAGAVTARLRFDPEARLRPQPTLTVDPATGLVDGERVHVGVQHLAPGTPVSFALCAAGARSTFDDRCFLYDATAADDEQAGEGRPADEDGAVATDLVALADAYAYRERVDCRAEACELVATAAGVVLARAAVAFAPGAALLGPARLSVSPARGVEVGDRVEVRGSGFYPGEPVLIEQCEAGSTTETCIGGPTARWVADGTGRFEGTFTVRRHAATDHQAVDCLILECVLRADRYDFVPLASREVEAPLRLVP